MSQVDLTKNASVPHLTSEDEEDLVAFEEEEEAGNGASKNTTNHPRFVASSSSSSSSKGPQGDVKFPIRLHEMLQDVHQSSSSSSLTEIVSWNPDGTAFKVHDKSQFETILLPKYFLQTKYRSFQRQLNHYGFERIANGGAFDGGYKHAHFLRDDSGKCHQMRRLKRQPLLRRMVASTTDSHPCDYSPSQRMSPFPSSQHRQPLVVSPDASIGRPIAQPILVGNNTPACHNYGVTYLPPHPFSAPVPYHHHHHPPATAYPVTVMMPPPPPPSAYPSSYVVTTAAARPTARAYLPGGGYHHPPPTAVVPTTTPSPSPTTAVSPPSEVTYVYLTPPAVVVPGTATAASTSKKDDTSSPPSASPLSPPLETPKRGMVLCEEEDLPPPRPPPAADAVSRPTMVSRGGRQVSNATPLSKPSCLTHRDRSISLRSTNSVNDLLLDFLDEQAAQDDGLLGAVWISQGNHNTISSPQLPPSLSARTVSVDDGVGEDPSHDIFPSMTATTTTQMVAL